MMLPNASLYVKADQLVAGSRVLWDGQLVTFLGYSVVFDVSGLCLIRLDSGQLAEVRYVELCSIANGPDQLFLDAYQSLSSG